MAWQFDFHSPPKGLTYATLTCKFPEPGEVKFKFNPDSIQMQQRSKSTQRPNLAGGGGNQTSAQSSVLKGIEPVTYTLQKVDLAGGNVKKDCDQIMKWMQPGGGAAGLLGQVASATPTAANHRTEKPKLMFTWGKGFTFKCTLKRVRVKFVRFDVDGMPTRAELSSLQLEEVPELTRPQNPTSGGAPGRRSHLVSAGESLPGIATGAYGRAMYWREIADLNGIDDPLRIQAGDHLYLPNTDELLSGRPVPDKGGRR